MKKLFLSIFIALGCCFAIVQQAAAFKAFNEKLTVTRVYDGDTFTGRSKSGTIYKIRIYGIDAPERTQDQGMYSRAYLEGLIGDSKVVEVNVVDIDFYGRYVAYVFNAAGEDLSFKMIEAGMAWTYEEYGGNGKYRNAEKKAKAEGLGVHANPWAIRPADYRRMSKERRKNY